MDQRHSGPRWLLLLVLLLLSSLQSPQISVAGAPSAAVVASNFVFTPAQIVIPVGATVTWTNASGTHNVVADDGSFTSGAPSTQFTFERQFTTPGTYNYYCILHGAPGGSGMSGRVVVTGATDVSVYLPLVVR